ncbi:hypothetical protein TRVA0_028S00804 [Trichomonascus vanleenenianus]|uniref:uncharacterized protein n=1 Tax=Trichomonascus vanleenenianus TaxID=2268995 RepID=UPI003ECAA98A
MVNQCEPNIIKINGHVSHDNQGELFYVQFEVPAGVTEIHAVYSYSHKGDGNNLDFGVFGLDTALNTSQFRGWSGGARDQFVISYEDATPGYLAGAIPPGKWHICFGPYRVREEEGIDWDLVITLKYESNRALKPFTPTPAPSRALEYEKLSPYSRDATSKWYRGDLHVHSVHSDGKHKPDELISAARKRSLDFFFSTEHNTSSAGLDFGRYVPSDFLVGRGEEVTTKYGHWNAIGLNVGQWIDARIPDDESLKKAVAQVHDSDGFAIINHPFDIQLACGWGYSFIDEMDAIEVWNGPWKAHDEDYRNINAVAQWDKFLRENKVFTAVGASDTHFMPRDVIGRPQTVICSTDLSVASLICALRKRKAYIVGEPEYSIAFSVTDPETGETSEVGGYLNSAAKMLSAQVQLNGLPSCRVCLLTNNGLLMEEPCKQDCNLSLEINRIADMKWIRLEVRDNSDNMLGLTNPIWFS